MFNSVNTKIVFNNIKLLPREIDLNELKNFIYGVLTSLSFNISELVIELSSLEPSKTYGVLSLEDVKKELIKKLKNKDPNCDDLIDKILNSKSKEELMELSSWCAEILMDRNVENGHNSYLKEREMVEDLIGQISFTSLVLGCFYYEPYWDYDVPYTKNEKIILYIKNIQKVENNYGSLFNAYKAVIYHEMFHYLHLLESKNADYTHEFSHRYDYLSDVIRESFAAYFEFAMCEADGIKTNHRKQWNLHSIKIFPYSCAKYINDLSHLANLIKESKHNGMNTTLLDLIQNNFRLYYELINQKQYNNYFLSPAITSYSCLDRFYDYLKAVLSKNTADKYRSAIKKLCNDYNIDLEDLFNGDANYSIDDLIGIYETDRKDENEKRSGEITASLKKFKEFSEKYNHKNIQANRNKIYRNQSFNCIDEFYDYLKTIHKKNTADKYRSAIKKVCIDHNINLDDLFTGTAFYSIDDLIGIYETDRKDENEKRSGEITASLKKFKIFSRLYKFKHSQENVNNIYVESSIIHFITAKSQDGTNSIVKITTDFKMYLEDLIKQKGLSMDEASDLCEVDLDLAASNYIDIETLFKICIGLKLEYDEGMQLLDYTKYQLNKDYFIDEVLDLFLYVGLYDKKQVNSHFVSYIGRKIFK